MSIVGPPSDADIKRMKCSDVMSPLLAKYVASIRRANAIKHQASSTEQQLQQLQPQSVSAALKTRFRGASDVLLTILQRLLSFDPECRISAGDAFVQLLTSLPESSLPASASASLPLAASASPGVLTASSPSPPAARLHKHPIDSTLQGGHKGDSPHGGGCGCGCGCGSGFIGAVIIVASVVHFTPV
jgi:hypothetical protein